MANFKNPMYGQNKFDEVMDKFMAVNSDYDLTATDSGDGVSTGKAEGGIIELRCNDLGSGENVVFTTPFAFEVQDVWLIIPNGEHVGSKTYTLQNGATAITDAMAGSTDKGRVDAATIDSGQTVFAKGDDDLKVVSSAHADGNARIYIRYKTLA